MSKKYQIIYCDPPWKYKLENLRGGANNHYKTEDLIDIKDLNIQDISEKNCCLLMWATYPQLVEALDLGKSWGFDYKTVAFTWVKKNTKSNSNFVGMGYYTRSNAEICLLFTKGNPLKRASKAVQQIIEHKIGKHSQKPHEARKRIVQLFGDIPRVELFAREREGMFGMDEYEGWDVFGNEVNNSIEL